MSESMYQVIAHSYVKEERAEAVAAALRKLAKASRLEPDNLGYYVTRSLEDGTQFVIVESYPSPAGFRAHRDSVHFKTIAVSGILPDLEHRTVTTFVGSGAA